MIKCFFTQTLLIKNNINYKNLKFFTSSLKKVVKLSAQTQSSTMRVLNVAEKNDAAKSIAEIMSRGGFQKREGFSKFNKIYEFPFNIFNTNVTMVMTSVSGHLLTFEFSGQYKNWLGCNPVVLFEAPLQKTCPDNYKNIKRTLEREIRSCNTLIIWTDCDREGENIGCEIIEVCSAVKSNIKIYRAKFSEITYQAVQRAVNNLGVPDLNVNEAVNARMELDLRIGAAFTRFQTLRLKRVFPTVLADQLISYGSCQFPTLGFVVAKYKEVQAFVQEPFWKIKVLCITKEGEEIEFLWKRQRLFDCLACRVFYEHCIENPEMKIVDIKSKPKSKWRPCALDTVELEKMASRKLRINAKEAMKIAEKLYTKGFISYPRTETNSFPKDFDLKSLIEHQVHDPSWGCFAAQLLERGPTPRNGNKSDQAHPPIHPTKYTNSLQGNDKTVYEFVVRHFLACCSQDAQGHETTVEAEINEEKFSISGLMIIARNYLEIYPYEKWNSKTIPVFQIGQTFMPNSIELAQGETSPPSLLTESDLIALMEKHGIGTDATHAEHIETIKSRLYVGVQQDGKFVPGELGMGLVEGYDAMGYEMSKPNLRAELEADLKRVCLGQKAKNVVLAEQIKKYKDVFIEACNQASKIDEALSQYFGNAEAINLDLTGNLNPQFPLCKCGLCGNDMVVKSKKDRQSFYVSCMGYPNCKNVIWLPSFVTDIIIQNNICTTCSSNLPSPLQKVKLNFKPGSTPPFIPNQDYISCLGGCDEDLTQLLGIKFQKTPNSGSNQQHNHTSRDSGINSISLSSSNSTNITKSSKSNINKRSTSLNSSINNSHSMQTSEMEFDLNDDFLMEDECLGNYISSFNTQPLRSFEPLRTTLTNRFPQSQSTFSPLNVFSRGNVSDLRSRNTLDNHLNDENNENRVVCSCGEEAKLLTVKKEGPNKGRQFYSCPKPQESKCSFFLWSDTETENNGQVASQIFPRFNSNSQIQNNVRGNNSDWRNKQPGPSRPSVSTNNDNQSIMCGCGQPAKLKTVQKDGPNKGRCFYGCSKPMGQGCSFFQWSDETCNQQPSFNQPSRNNFPSNNNKNSFGKRKTDAIPNNGSAKKRKCGLCGEEGHTKKTCPHK